MLVFEGLYNSALRLSYSGLGIGIVKWILRMFNEFDD